MSENVLVGLEGEEELRAAARSRVYAALCDALAFPDEERLREIRRGDLVRTLRGALQDADPALAEAFDWSALAEAGAGEDDLAVEYTRLFEVGASGPPCALYGGVYGDSRMKTMEEAVRFYNHFGLTLAEDPRELPDHLTTELEFLHFLSFREAETLRAGLDAGPFRRAQRDFVARHPGRWLPKLAEKLVRAKAGLFYVALFTLVGRWLAREERTLTALAGRSAAA